MKLANYKTENGPRAVVLRNDRLHFLGDLDPRFPEDLLSLLEAGPDALHSVSDALDRAGEGQSFEEARLLAPLPRPAKFLGIGFNYQSHVDEVQHMGLPIPDLNNQIWFNKQTSCIVGPWDPIHLPAVSEQLDWEAELAIVIGRRCRHVPKDRARDVIAGYMVTNDVSVRDWQLKTPTATLGKSFDTHGPTGPWITTADEIEDPETLGIRSFVNGELMQDGNTNELVNKIDSMIAYLTTVMTLEPGDILATGTPNGVGASRKPPRWLKAGEVVRIEIDGLGHLENRVIAEPKLDGALA